MMQKDEAELLLAWLSHYGNLFGYRNLTIYDNGSTDLRTVAILQHALRLGVVIETGFGDAQDFHRKGSHFTRLIQQWDRIGGCDFALPVDCDEFLAVFEDDHISTSRDAILAELSRHLGIERALRMDMSLFNVPDQAGWYSPDRSFHKGMVAAGTLREIDSGQHDPQTRVGGCLTTRLTYLHRHNRPYDAYIERTRQKLDPSYQHITDPNEIRRLANDPQVPGNHLLRALQRSREEYLSQYDRDLRVRSEDLFGAKVELIDASGPLHWNSCAYLARHPDVARHEQGPLHHYLRFGWIEGRDVAAMRAA